MMIATLVGASSGFRISDDQPCTLIGCVSPSILTVGRTLPRGAFVESPRAFRETGLGRVPALLGGPIFRIRRARSASCGTNRTLTRSLKGIDAS